MKSIKNLKENIIIYRNNHEIQKKMVFGNIIKDLLNVFTYILISSTNVKSKEVKYFKNQKKM